MSSSVSQSYPSPRRYSESFKLKAVRMVLEQNLSIQKAAEKLHCAPMSVRHTDASTAPFRIPKEKHRCVKGNLYVYIGDSEHPFNIYNFQENQSAQGIHEFLKGYGGSCRSTQVQLMLGKICKFGKLSVS